MNCEDIKKLLLTYLEDRLPSFEKTLVKEHLLSCPVCQKEERLLKETWQWLDILEPLPPSPNFQIRFWEKVREEEEGRLVWRLLPRWALGFVVVWMLGVGLGSILFYRHQAGINLNERKQEGFIQWVEPFDIESVYLKRWSQGVL